MLIVGYLIGNRTQAPITPPPIVIQNCNASPKIEYVYIHLQSESTCSQESFEDDFFELFEDESYEDESYEDLLEENMYEGGENYDEFEDSYSIENFHHTRHNSDKLLMLGYRKSGAFEAKLKIPVHESLGFYVGYDTERQYSFGASINLF